MSEREPLLQPEQRRSPTKKPWYRPRPLWLVSCAIISSLCRGMTTASRTEVLVQIACQNYWRNQPHHTEFPILSNSLSSYIANTFQPIYPPFDPTSSPINSSPVHVSDNDEHVQDCATNTAVQANAAKLQTIITTTMGLLSALSTGWWGQFGDYHGRTKVLAAAQFGIMFTDSMFLIASNPPDKLKQHGQVLLLISPIVEGMLGGLSTVASATNAYISDCTSHGSRAQIFSRFTGAGYVGFALGPEIAALILRRTERTTPVFLTSVVLASLNWIFILFIMPESLTLEVREKNQKLAVQQQTSDHSNVPKKTGLRRTIKRTLRKFLEPLTMFAPVQRQQGRGLDWSLTLLAVSTFSFQLSIGVIQLKYLYAKHIFSWSAETLSYYITAAGTIRALHLLLILPTVIKLTKPAPKPWPTAAAVLNEDPELNTGATMVSTSNVPSGPEPGITPMTSSSNVAKKKPPPNPLAILSEIKFDLWVARISLFLDFLSHSLVAIAPSASVQLFAGFSLVNSMGTGLVPALHSIAMCTLYLRERNVSVDIDRPEGESRKGGKDVGKLFGSLAVLQAVGMSILGPMLFGSVYSITVATFPKAIFVLAASLIVMAIAMLCLIRPPRVDFPIQIRVETHVRTSVERLRGRPRSQKDIAEELRLGEALNY
ncbi:hypothetical protein Clacol_002845 [Clathrus columnatus]|uniref:MFS general substrate transporter n=1 Tax=Clathrus columnatus TaxID=1419009 RepID=A0AAV5A1U1_9AGAM|nr:hypothetical protein Clacol_002845 [Clathrus columnatus]